jgi:DNA-3-methyladenine glycosylase I
MAGMTYAIVHPADVAHDRSSLACSPKRIGIQMTALAVGEDGRRAAAGEPEIYRLYDDEQTTHHRRPPTLRKICPRASQAGLRLTILRKRTTEGVADSICLIVGFDDSDVVRLLDDPGIIRHQGKIRSTINNAGRALELAEERGSLSDYFWPWAGPEQPAPVLIEPSTASSTALSKDLKRRGWTFVGPTTVYAFMQAVGLVNDHVAECHVRQACRDERRSLVSRS